MAAHTPSPATRTSRKPLPCDTPLFINTRLQRGEMACRGGVNRFSGFCTAPKTAEAVQGPSRQTHTPLKRGVNESGSNRSAGNCVTFGLGLLTVLALSALTCRASETKTVWQIGTRDRNNAEFALAPHGYDHFAADGFFVVRLSDPKTAWPYVH